METLHENKALYEGMTRARPGNDNRPASSRALLFGRSVFPEDAVARIYQPGRSVATSARSRPGWRLVFERRTAPFIEPLMGYTGSRDTLTQVEMSFPTLESAIRYAERQGLSYVVRMPAEQVGDDRSTDNDKKPGGVARHTPSLALTLEIRLQTFLLGRCRLQGRPFLNHLKSFEHWRFR